MIPYLQNPLRLNMFKSYDILKRNHPPDKPVSPGSITLGNVDPPVAISAVLFDRIHANLTRSATLCIYFAAGQYGIDAYVRRRMHSSFHSASNDICQALAKLPRCLCTFCIYPHVLALLMACCLIPLDKNPSVCNIGICS